MSPDFPDELLSAYLDGELSPDERAGVESHLASCEADRQLLDELRALRHDVAALPRANVKPDFAEQVVKSVVAAHLPAATLTPASTLRRRNWFMLAAVVAGAAACFLLFVRQSWQSSGGGLSNTANAGSPVASPAERLIASLRAAAPGEGEATVVRLRLPKQLSGVAAFDAALKNAGIVQREATDAASGAKALGIQYQRQVSSANVATVPAAEVLFVEAPLAQLESALAAIAGSNQTVELATEFKLAFVQQHGAEGEGGSSTSRETRSAPGQSFVQHLPTGTFRLQRRDAFPADPGAEIAPARNDARPVRLLILVEQIDNPR